LAKSSVTKTEPRIGLFWGLPVSNKWRFVGISSPLSQVDAIGGFRTHPRGHIEVWPHILRRYPELRDRDYEAVPRGRVNWVEEGDQFLLLLDTHLQTRKFIAKIMQRWHLPEERTRVMSDPHYQTP
jgi:hypothetical protein